MTLCDAFWQGLCVVTSTSLGFAILFLQSDQREAKFTYNIMFSSNTVSSYYIIRIQGD